jgi:hypothetical protein
MPDPRRVRDAVAAYNKRIDLLISTSNALALAFFGLAFVKPMVDGTMALDGAAAVSVAVGLAMHGVAHYVTRYVEKEDGNAP